MVQHSKANTNGCKWIFYDILQVLSVLDRVSMARREGELNTTKRQKTKKEYMKGYKLTRCCM